MSLAPDCKIVSMTAMPVEATLCMWFNSRDMRMPGEPWVAHEFWSRLTGEYRQYRESRLKGSDFFILKALTGEKWEEPVGNEDAQNRALYDMAYELFFAVLAIDAPCREFIVFNLTFSNVPRTFVDQLDRTRNAGFWEQSVRVKDLSTFADAGEYFEPPDCRDPEVAAEYRKGMQDAQWNYTNLVRLGMRPEHARGVVPMHINVRADMVVNLRTLQQLISKRTCFFAQGDYWAPVVQSFLTELMTSPMSTLPRDKKIVELFTGLPCDGKGACPYHRDLMDRLVDRSNPICPILYERYLDQSERDRTSREMESMYGHDSWVEASGAYLASLGRDPSTFIQTARSTKHSLER